MSNILRDTYSFGELQILSEGKSSGGPMVVQGLFQEAEAKNGNGRVYSKTILLWKVIKLLELLKY